MAQRLIAFWVVLAALCFGSMSAQAKVPIPCTSEKIVKVANLPRTSEFTLPSGQQIDLGYLYQGCFSGKWIGYVGASNRYMNWTDGMLPDVIAASGMKALPPEPGLLRGLFTSPGQFWVEWLFAVIVVGGVLAKVFGPQTASQSEPVAQAARKPEADAPVQSAGMEAALKAAVAARATGGDISRAPARSAKPLAEAAPRRPTRPAQTASAGPIMRSAAPVFGRRA